MALVSCSSIRGRRAFTLIELLIVVAIVAVLIAIIVPAISRAREQARIVKCLVQQRSLVQAVSMFADQHNGYGQLMVVGGTRLPIHRQRYAYEPPGRMFPSNGAGLVLSPWIIAYAPYIGATDLTSEEYFLEGGLGAARRIAQKGTLLGALRKKRQVTTLQCPSYRDLVSLVSSPSFAFGLLSYNISLDLFGGALPFGGIWRAGDQYGGPELRGKLDRVVRPHEVLVFVDGGSNNPGVPTLRYFRSSHNHGPTLSTFGSFVPWLPTNRHSADGGLVASFLDGHATYLNPVEWAIAESSSQIGASAGGLSRVAGQRYPTRYSPNPRMTPYGPYGTGDTAQDQGSIAVRGR